MRIAATNHARGVVTGIATGILGLLGLVLLLFPAQGFAERGDLDPSFGSRGYAQVPGLESSAAVVTLDGGTIVVGGLNTAAESQLAGVGETGSVDPGFGEDGILDLDPPLAQESIEALVAESGGGALVLTTGSSTSHLVRITAEGEVDALFGNAGVVDLPHRSNTLATDSQGRLIVTADRTVERFLADGSVDTSWGTSGVDEFPFYIAGAVTDSTDRVLVGGYVRNSIRYFKLTEEGAYDASYPYLTVYDRRSSIKRMAPDGAGGAWVVLRACVGRGYCSNYLQHVLADGTLGPLQQDDFSPRGPLLASQGESVQTGGGYRFGWPYAPDTSVLVRADGAAQVERSFGVDGRAYLYPDRKPAFAAAMSIDTAGATVIATTPYRNIGDGVLVARLLPEGEGADADADADAVPDTDDRCPAIPGESDSAGCPLLKKRPITLGLKGTGIHGRLSGPVACTYRARVKVVKVKRRGPAKPIGKTRSDYRGGWSIEGLVHRGRYKAIALKTYGSGSGVCRRAESKIRRVR